MLHYSINNNANLERIKKLQNKQLTNIHILKLNASACLIN